MMFFVVALMAITIVLLVRAVWILEARIGNALKRIAQLEIDKDLSH